MSESVLEKLKEGARRFQVEVHAKRADDYRRVAETAQSPHTLIIGCADSRVDVGTITSSEPGELFVNRNVGNMVPPYNGVRGGVSAVIEYAVTALRVKHAVICGHSDCGAIKGLLHPELTSRMPTVRAWLQHGQAALMVTRSLEPRNEDECAELARLTEENVLMQLVHLRTHPSVAGAMARGELTISGWVYDIGTGVVRVAEEGERVFVPVTAEVEA